MKKSVLEQLTPSKYNFYRNSLFNLNNSNIVIYNNKPNTTIKCLYSITCQNNNNCTYAHINDINYDYCEYPNIIKCTSCSNKELGYGCKYFHYSNVPILFAYDLLKYVKTFLEITTTKFEKLGAFE